MKYRVTRPKLYPEGSAGHKDPSARQGHYLEGNSAGSVLMQMHARYPEDEADFTIQIWEGERKGLVLFDGHALVV